MDEYYVRAPQAEQADGPFTIEQLRELASSEIIQSETLYYVEGMDDFAPFSENPELWNQVSSTSAEKPKALKLRSSQPASPEPPPTSAPSEETTPAAPEEPPPAAHQYFVRAPESETADGPFSLGQLRELADSKVITGSTLYFYEGMEDFAPIESNPALWGEIKPAAKPALKLRSANKPKAPPPEDTVASEETSVESGKRKKEKVPSKSEAAEPQASPYDESGDVDRMLAAAEGKTEQTRHVQRLKKSRERAVAVLLPGIVLSLLMGISVIVQPYWETIYGMFQSGDYSLDFLLENWIFFFAIVDLFLAIGIGLGQTGLFPLLRLRAGIGLGFFFYLFYSRMEWEAMGAMSALQIGLLGATLCTRFATTAFFSLLALGGAGVMIWLAWFQGIAF